MKVTITHMKAPWPEGAKVGDVVQFEGDAAPAWALGKFAHADDDARADHKYVPAAESTFEVATPAPEHAEVKAATDKNGKK